MDIKNIIIYFLTGGIMTTIIVVLEEGGYGMRSGFAALMPMFTLIAYLFIGQAKGGKALSQNARMVLIGSIVAWVPYMITVALLAPRMSTNKAIGIGMIIFFILATIYLLIVNHYHLFQ